ncbi:hypothetical protein RND81_04G124500 [Saponaria officinalis]|uniref:Uncharacterized protein n=1 Tax=Saponaria officinalis TaxID=3572 RepID=A0AAW1LK12_SAPOF
MQEEMRKFRGGSRSQSATCWGNKDGNTTLHIATANGDLTKAICSDKDDGCNGAELLAAAEEGRGEDVMSILVKNPRLFRTGDCVGNTVLHMAARDGDIVTVCNLIAFLEKIQNKDIKEVFMDVNFDGDTALHLALKNGHRKVAYHLINSNASTGSIKNNDWITPNELAFKAGFSEVCGERRRPILASLGDIEIAEQRWKLAIRRRSLLLDHWTELYRAIKKGDEDALVKGLMRDGKELMCINTQQETLLHAAVTAPAMGPFRQLVQFMINNNLTVVAFSGNKDGDTALHIATENGDLTKAICLIEAAPRTVYEVNDKRVSPLCLAVKYGHDDLVKLMVTQSCLPPWESQMRLHRKHAALAHLAIKNRSLGTLNILMEHLPELVKGTDEKGWRPLSYAANKGYLDEVTYLLTRFPKSAEETDEDGSFPIHKDVNVFQFPMVVMYSLYSLMCFNFRWLYSLTISIYYYDIYFILHTS